MTRPILAPLMEMTQRAVSTAIAAARETNAPFFLVDATAGNGHDTLLLAREAGKAGRVFAFDVQQSAIAGAKKRIEEAGLAERVTFVHAGHETAGEVLPAAATGRLWAATFNLGYLPGSDKRIVTGFSTTVAALKTVTAIAAGGCVISVHAYRGHDGGEEELQHLSAWLRKLPWEAWRVAEYSFINKRKNGEALFLLEKARSR